MKINKNLDKDKIYNPFTEALFKATLKLHELAIRDAPSGATNELKTKIDLFPKMKGQNKYYVRSMANHSEFVEKGTRPHPVSPKHLIKWARRKLGNENAAYAVAKSIAKKGTKAHPFFMPNYEEVKNFWLPHYIEKELNKQRTS